MELQIYLQITKRIMVAKATINTNIFYKGRRRAEGWRAEGKRKSSEGGGVEGGGPDNKTFWRAEGLKM